MRNILLAFENYLYSTLLDLVLIQDALGGKLQFSRRVQAFLFNALHITVSYILMRFFPADKITGAYVDAEGNEVAYVADEDYKPLPTLLDTHPEEFPSALKLIQQQSNEEALAEANAWGFSNIEDFLSMVQETHDKAEAERCSCVRCDSLGSKVCMCAEPKIEDGLETDSESNYYRDH